MATLHGAQVVDLDKVPALSDRRFWHSDRLHLNAEGHTRVAAAVLQTLGAGSADPDRWTRPLPPKPPANRREDFAADLAWARNYFAPWVVRRLRGVSSGDGRTAKDPEFRTLK